MPILKLRPACKDNLWGGERLRTDFGIDSTVVPLAEAWMLSCHPDGPSVIADGPCAGQTLPDWLAAHPGAAGSRCEAFARFPVLVKFIDAKNDLSIQVHPSDEYALAHEGQYGKTEMWYILDCTPDAHILYGFARALTREEFARRIDENTLEEVVHRAPVHKGDVFFIPAGTLHTICGGIVLAEVQESSNVTYRIHDYGRKGPDGKPRALHIPQALAVTTLGPVRVDEDFGGHLARCPYFTVDLCEGAHGGAVGESSFAALLAVDGAGTLRCGGESVPLRRGECAFLPAGSGAYQVEGGLCLLKVTV